MHPKAYPRLKLAAIDIGSNAIRFQVINVLEYKGQITFKRLEYIRFPLRLGKEVFNTRQFSHKTIDKIIKLMKSFKLMLELYEVDDFKACATSAFREAENGEEVAELVLKHIGLRIKIIDGNEEAFLINKTLESYVRNEQSYLHIDVGGGSTELTIYSNSERLWSTSFPIGTVRILEGMDDPKAWETMRDWVRKHSVDHRSGDIISIGTGGNINKIFELSRAKAGKPVSLKTVKRIRDELSTLPLEELLNVVQLNPDRADVIIPAAEIYLSVMRWAKSKKILVPDVGLKDGILLDLFERNKSQLKLV